jgi:hypothetical protein
MKHEVTSLTTGRVSTGTRQAVSFHQGNMAEGETGTTEICTMSSAAEMHAAGLKTDVRSVSALNRSSMKKETMITMIPIMSNLTDGILLKGGAMQEESRLFSHDLKRVPWPLNFKPSGIEKYDGSTNLAEWLEVYQLTIEAASGDSYVMANNLLVFLSSSART